MNAAVDAYLAESPDWCAELTRLRAILLDCGLSEEFKWKQPCYSIDGGNVVILGSLKAACALSFFKGALLKDEERILGKPGENTQSARVIKFTSVAQIDEIESVLRAYIAEAIANEKQGLKVDFKESNRFEIPEELQAEFDVDPSFQSAWEKLTPGRQRAYVLHFSSAKQSATRTNRIEKMMPRIMDGYGMNDCTCGHSKRMPGCDGSHKFLG
ncbi:DUF1801 domain-containing protein [Cerasicoccus frondis]|uniref:DUF1801 domain-containing protein n=1 Tax=Cerasicoccus frondis TaxID=490090 RepID=UPI002852770D|nr:YdeI/OmpD-associated family protein [Cerasicoccus frondis]